MILSIAIAGAPTFARLTRGEVLALRGADLRGSGSGGRRQGRPSHVPTHPSEPSGPPHVASSLAVGTAILVESTLGFLGLGLSPPTPAWGLMVNEGLQIMRGAWWDRSSRHRHHPRGTWLQPPWGRPPRPSRPTPALGALSETRRTNGGDDAPTNRRHGAHRYLPRDQSPQSGETRVLAEHVVAQTTRLEPGRRLRRRQRRSALPRERIAPLPARLTGAVGHVP